MKLIDVDALKKEWRMGNKCEECERNARDCNYNDFISQMDVCSMLDDAPTVSLPDALRAAGWREEEGWVNVKDELPEEDTDVLVWNNLGMEIAAYTTNPVKRWYSYTGQEVFVKYWMPLPEPPKEEK